MNKKISKELEGVISKMLKPLKGLPLGIVIEGLSGYKAIPYNNRSAKDRKVLSILKKCADNVLEEVNKKGILRPRPNEVGNDIEPFVKEALNNLGYNADTPVTINGKKNLPVTLILNLLMNLEKPIIWNVKLLTLTT